jgi:hypothetical protein
VTRGVAARQDYGLNPGDKPVNLARFGDLGEILFAGGL